MGPCSGYLSSWGQKGRNPGTSPFRNTGGQWGWEPLGSHSVLMDMPSLSQVPSSCLRITWELV